MSFDPALEASDESTPLKKILKDNYRFVCSFRVAHDDIFDDEDKTLAGYSKKLLRKLSYYNDLCHVKFTSKSYAIRAFGPELVAYARCYMKGCKKFRIAIDRIRGLDEVEVRVSETEGPIIHGHYNLKAEKERQREATRGPRKPTDHCFYTFVASFSIDHDELFDAEDKPLVGYSKKILQRLRLYNDVCRVKFTTKTYDPDNMDRIPQFSGYARCLMKDCKKYKISIDRVTGYDNIVIRVGESDDQIKHAPMAKPVYKEKPPRSTRSINRPIKLPPPRILKATQRKSPKKEKPVRDLAEEVRKAVDSIEIERFDLENMSTSRKSVEQQIQMFKTSDEAEDVTLADDQYKRVCSFSVSHDQLFNENDQLLDDYVSTLIRMFDEYQSPCCPIVTSKVLRDYPGPKQCQFIVYLKCVIKGCKRFKLTISRVSGYKVLVSHLSETSVQVFHEPIKRRRKIHTKPPKKRDENPDLDFGEVRIITNVPEDYDLNPDFPKNVLKRSPAYHDSFNAEKPVATLYVESSPLVKRVQPLPPLGKAPFEPPAKKMRESKNSDLYNTVHSFTIHRHKLFFGIYVSPECSASLLEEFAKYNSECRLQVTNKCLLNSTPGSLNFIAYGVCEHKNCKKFRFSIRDGPSDKELWCDLSESSGQINHPKPVEEPSEAVDDCPEPDPETKIIEIQAAPEESPKPPPSQTRIRVVSVRRQDEIVEMYQVKSSLNEQDTNSRCLKGFVQDIGYDPFFVILMCEEQHQVYKNLGRKGNLVLFLDAFPTVFKPLSRQPKKSLIYYTAVAKGVHWSVPVASCITESRDCSDVFVFFNRLMGKSFASDDHYYQPNILNTDASIAILQACVSAFNCGSVISYLKRMWNLYVENSSDQLTTTIHWSSSHVMNRVCRYLKTHCESSNNEPITGIISLLIRSKDFSFQEKLINMMFVLCNSDRKHQVFHQFKDKYDEMMDCFGGAIIEPFDGREISYIEEEVNYDYYCRHSPYAQHFQKMLTSTMDNLKQKSQATLPPNDLYNPSFITYFVKHLAPFLPLWTACGLARNDLLSEDEKVCLNNKLVQTTFSCLQEEVLNPNTKHKCTDVISDMYTYHQAVAKTYLASYCEQPQEKSNAQDSSDPPAISGET